MPTNSTEREAKRRKKNKEAGLLGRYKLIHPTWIEFFEANTEKWKKPKPSKDKK